MIDLLIFCSNMNNEISEERKGQWLKGENTKMKIGFQ